MKITIFVLALIVLASAQDEPKNSFIENVFKNSKEQVFELFNKLISQGNTCDLQTGVMCVSDLKGLFGGCTTAISTSGASIFSDFQCIKALWNMNTSQVKTCYGCICDFAHAVKVNLPLCHHDQKLLQGGVNVFEELLKQDN